jgi:hypothetical protein
MWHTGWGRWIVTAWYPMDMVGYGSSISNPTGFARNFNDHQDYRIFWLGDFLALNTLPRVPQARNDPSIDKNIICTGTGRRVEHISFGCGTRRFDIFDQQIQVQRFDGRGNEATFFIECLGHIVFGMNDHRPTAEFICCTEHSKKSVLEKGASKRRIPFQTDQQQAVQSAPRELDVLPSPWLRVPAWNPFLP